CIACKECNDATTRTLSPVTLTPRLFSSTSLNRTPFLGLWIRSNPPSRGLQHHVISFGKRNHETCCSLHPEDRRSARCSLVGHLRGSGRGRVESARHRRPARAARR